MIEVRALTKRYGDTLAVDGLTFDVAPGSVTGFLGPNGAGKSTTMRLIMGLDHPATGHVAIDGRGYAELKNPLRVVGALLDARAFHPGRSARSHLLALATTNGLPTARVDEVIDTVGLTSVAGRRAGGFSLGMGQRLGIAAALLGDPGILLFDEPANGLDPDGIVWVRTLLRGLAAGGRAIFVSSHLMSEMALTADHLVVIGKGRLIADTGVAQFIATSSKNSVLARSPAAAELGQLLDQPGVGVRTEGDGSLRITGLECAAVGRIAATHGIELHELSPQAASLEEAFMELTRDEVEFQADSTRRLAPAGN